MIPCSNASTENVRGRPGRVSLGLVPACVVLAARDRRSKAIGTQCCFNTAGSIVLPEGVSPLGLPWVARGGPKPRSAHQAHSLPLVRAVCEIASLLPARTRRPPEDGDGRRHDDRHRKPEQARGSQAFRNQRRQHRRQHAGKKDAANDSSYDCEHAFHRPLDRRVQHPEVRRPIPMRSVPAGGVAPPSYVPDMFGRDPTAEHWKPAIWQRTSEFSDMS